MIYCGGRKRTQPLQTRRALAEKRVHEKETYDASGLNIQFLRLNSQTRHPASLSCQPFSTSATAAAAASSFLIDNVKSSRSAPKEKEIAHWRDGMWNFSSASSRDVDTAVTSQYFHSSLQVSSISTML
jgi:hypothetical protein